MRIFCPPEDLECSACHASGTTRRACLVWEHHYPMTSLLFSHKLRRRSHVFVGHVVVVVKDWWDDLLFLGHLQTIMARKSVTPCLLSAAELVKTAVFKEFLQMHRFQRIKQYQDIWKEHRTHLSPPSRTHRWNSCHQPDRPRSVILKYSLAGIIVISHL